MITEKQYHFKCQAGEDGVIRDNKEVSLPLAGRLREFKLWTTSSCEGRAHKITIRIKNGNTDKFLFNDSIFHDCNTNDLWWAQPISLEKGSATITIEATGFSPNKQVEGVVWVKASIGG